MHVARRAAAIVLAYQCCALLACNADRAGTVDATRTDCLEACRSTIVQRQRAVDRVRFDKVTESSARSSGALSGTIVPRAVVLVPPTTGADLRLVPDATRNPLPNPEFHGVELRLDHPLDASSVSGLRVRATAPYQLTNAWIAFGSSTAGADGPDMTVVEFRFGDVSGTAVGEVELSGQPKWAGPIGYIAFGFQAHGHDPVELVALEVVRTGSGVEHARANDERHAVVHAPAPSSCTCNATIPAGARLDVSFGIAEPSQAAKGVTFCVSVGTQAQPRMVVWSRYLSAAQANAGRSWESASIPLDGFGESDATIDFETFSGSRCESVGDPESVRTAWAGLDLVSSHRKPPSRPSVVLISLDTLRADRLGCYGAGRQTSPAIDSMAAEGVLFEQAISQAPETHSSHMSLFTGLYPTEHRVQRHSDVLSPELPYLVESFRNAGYRTAAVTEGGFVAAHYGFDRGFQSYEEADPDATRRELVGRTFADANAWLERFAGQSFFLFVHTYDVHPPLDPPEQLLAQFAGDYRGAIPVPFPAEMNPSLEQLLRNSRFSPEDLRFVRNLYDAGVRNADDHVASLLATLRKLEILDSTLVVLLSDHGEELADHFSIPQHGHTLYDELVRVPLVFRGPGVQTGVRIHDEVRLIDVLPTLLELAGLPLDPQSVSGRSVAPMLRGERMEIAPAFSVGVAPTERLAVRTRVDAKRYKLIRTSGFLESPWIGQIRELSDLSRLRSIPAEVELFDLDEDPHELTNVASSRPAVVERLDGLLADYTARSGREPTTPREAPPIPAHVAERLRSLGYLSSEQ
jgi:arylsulfatase A-like enzyme